jgi:uncharacterized protein (TIGR03435 family)
MRKQTLLLPVALLFIKALHAQVPAPDRLEFEVASVRPAAPLGKDELPATRGGPGSSDPERITYRAIALRDLIMEVYGIGLLQLSVPDQFRFRLRYDILAKIPRGTTKEQLNMMVQKLLVDRFGMRFHREPKQFETYKLVIAQGGPKLKDTAFKSDLSAAEMSNPPARHDPDGTVYAAGRIVSPMRDGRRVVSGGKLTMEGLANYLERKLGGPVADATGLTGEYDIKIEVSPVGFALSPANANALSNGYPPDSASVPAPNIFQALERQLGLRLEKSTVMLDMMIVDHLDEVPTDN